MEADRPLEIGNLRKFGAWGAKFPQIANRPCPVCHGQVARLSAKGGLRLAPRGLQTAGSVLRDVGDLLRKSGKLAKGLWVLVFEILGV